MVVWFTTAGFVPGYGGDTDEPAVVEEIRKAYNSVPPEAEGIVLSDPGDTAEVRAYLRSLVQISYPSAPTVFVGAPRTSPMVDMYAEVGPENLGLLVRLLGAEHPHGFFVLNAVDRLATEDHKETVLAAFRDHVHLISVVERFGWEEPARNTLIVHVREQGKQVNPRVVGALARLQDPATYPLLIDYFEHVPMPERIYPAIKDLPGIDLEHSLEVVWEGLYAGRRHEFKWVGLHHFAGVLAGTGNREAFEFLIDRITGDPPSFAREFTHPPTDRGSVSTTIFQVTQTPDDLAANGLSTWLADNRNRLFFDPGASQWVVIEERTERFWTDNEGREILARMLRGSEGEVTIERYDGREFSVPLERLSPGDREYVLRQLLAESR